MLEWITDQVTILQTAFKESMTEEQQEIYVRALNDIPQEHLQTAFRRALCELVFFPKIAELRKLAGSIPADENKVEALAAWNHVNEYLRQWGVDRLPQRSGGMAIEAPPLDPRTDYALRRIGGLRALNWVLMKNLPFMQRDFCEAYELSGLAAHINFPQFTREKLTGSRPKELTGTVAAKAAPATDATSATTATNPEPVKNSEAVKNPEPVKIPRVVKDFFEPPTPDQLRDRAVVEKQRLEQWLAKRAAATGGPA